MARILREVKGRKVRKENESKNQILAGMEVMDERGLVGLHGVAASRVEIMEFIREVFEEEWVGWKNNGLETDLQESELWANGKGVKRYGVVAGALYFEERLLDKSYRPTRGILVGVRGKGRVNRVGRPKKFSRPRRRRIVVTKRRIVNLANKLQRLYETERNIKEKVILEPKVIAENKAKLIKLEKLVRTISLGKRVFTGSLDGERFIIHKRVWLEDKSLESGEVDFRLKYLVRWEHIGKLKNWTPKNNRFVKLELTKD